MDKRWAKWLPAVIVPVVIGVGVVAAPLTAGAVVDLPDKTPAQVIELAADSSVTAFSGTVEQTSNLGLPDLSGLGGSASGSAASAADISSAIELVTGSHTARVFVDGADARLQVLDSLAERDVVRTADDLWYYDSETAAATHVAIPAHSGKESGKADSGEQDATVQTPVELADRFLSEIDSSTAVSVGTDARVAGRTVYELILTPRTEDTLVGSVTIAVDSETGLPLSVAVSAKDATDPAFRLAFSELSLDTPDAGLFAFTPPAGTTVTEQALPTKPADDGTAETLAEPSGITTVGTGWSSVVELPAADVPPELAASPLLSVATQTVDGGRVLSTALVSVLFTDDGRVLAGAVTPQRLQDAAAGR
jgi:outer membrane lipoprotein-sorting protein